SRRRRPRRARQRRRVRRRHLPQLRPRVRPPDEEWGEELSSVPDPYTPPPFDSYLQRVKHVGESLKLCCDLARAACASSLSSPLARDPEPAPLLPVEGGHIACSPAGPRGRQRNLRARFGGGDRARADPLLRRPAERHRRAVAGVTLLGEGAR